MDYRTLKQFSDELQQITDAAHVLFLINRLKLDPETALELEILKQYYVGPRNRPQSIDTHQTPPRQNQFLRVSTHRQQQPPAPPMIERLQGIIGKQGQSVEKVLEETDLNSKLQRVVFDKEASSTFETFFSKEEQEVLGKIAKLKVGVYDSEGKEYKMCYEVWKFLKSRKPVLYGCEWNNFCLDHGLKTGDAVTLSIFRHASTRQICFFCSIRRKARTGPVVA